MSTPAQPTIVSLTSASLGSFTTLTCTTTGSPTTTVTWTRDGQPLTVDGHTYNMVQRVTNRAASTYDNLLIVSGPALGSTFTCTVTNTLGTDTSNSIRGMLVTNTEAIFILGRHLFIGDILFVCAKMRQLHFMQLYKLLKSMMTALNNLLYSRSLI